MLKIWLNYVTLGKQGGKSINISHPHPPSTEFLFISIFSQEVGTISVQVSATIWSSEKLFQMID